jgi:hypothetical protein
MELAGGFTPAHGAKVASNITPGGRGKGSVSIDAAAPRTGSMANPAQATVGMGGQAAQLAPRPRAGGRTNDAPAKEFGEKFAGGDARRHRKSEPVAYASQARRAALQKTGNSRLTWVPGDRPIEELDDTSARIAGATASGTSIFDPVLCEIAYRWFCPPGGDVLDPFAGGSVRGIVAAMLGRAYTGTELRDGQVAANLPQAEAIIPKGKPQPTWIVGDALTEIPKLPEAYGCDLVFGCPPYADLEVYSDDPRDLSSMPYDKFAEAYTAIVAAACSRLRDNRFALFVVGDIRDPKGLYRNFVGLTIAAFQAAGLKYYNEAVLITAVGSLPVRAGQIFEASRKLGKGHQNVLGFVKGDPKAATAACGKVEVPEELVVDAMLGELAAP